MELFEPVSRCHFMDEPSVLDYLKAKLNPRKYRDVLEALEWEEKMPQEPLSNRSDVMAERPEQKRAFRDLPWKTIAGVLFALIAQFILEPPSSSILAAVTFYFLAAIFIGTAFISKEIELPAFKPDAEQPMPLEIRKSSLYLGLPAALLAFLMFGGNRFTFINLMVWIIALGYFIHAFWVSQPRENGFLSWFENVVKAKQFKINISQWTLLLVLVVALSGFFRFYQLGKVPGEAFSDHAEKLLDVLDVLNGKTAIFFERNTGREAIQMYLTALIIKVFGTGVSFLSLKIGTALIGFMTLPYIYLIGKEFGGKWVGILSLFFAGIAYWPNVISRVGLRFPLYPFFVAPTFYYLIRGIRRSSRNDFVLAGMALGLGLHGYSPARFIPIMAVVGVGIYLLHAQSKGKRVETIFALLLLSFISLIVFLPLLRYTLDHPEMFGYRALTRLSTVERDFPGPPIQIFFSNLFQASIMPFWKNGNTWVHSVTNRPALDVVTAVFYFIGIVLLVLRYIRTRNWQDLFVILSVPLLMMPSILSLAFPEENPSLNRTGGAIVPVYLTAAMGFYAVFSSMLRKLPGGLGRKTVLFMGMTFMAISGFQNYDLVFRQYQEQFMNAAWNSSEMGETIGWFARTIGSKDSAYVVPYPHWVDTRLVGINAGYPEKDYALWPEDFAFSLEQTGSKLFIVRPIDANAIQKLTEMYPEGRFSLYQSEWPGKDYLVFFVPTADPYQPSFENDN